jgi:hypothetical protein
MSFLSGALGGAVTGGAAGGPLGALAGGILGGAKSLIENAFNQDQATEAENTATRKSLGL